MAQIAVRLDDEDLARLDATVASGRYASRAAAVRAGVEQLLRAERECEIVDAYRRGYGKHPQEEDLGGAGLLLMAAAIRESEHDAPELDGAQPR